MGVNSVTLMLTLQLCFETLVTQDLISRAAMTRTPVRRLHMRCYRLLRDDEFSGRSSKFIPCSFDWKEQNTLVQSLNQYLSRKFKWSLWVQVE